MPLGPKNLVLHDYARYFFLLAIVVVLVLFFWVISPFLNVIIYAALIAVVLTPVHRRLLKLVRGHQDVAAFLSTLLTVVVVLTPLTFFTIFLVEQAVNAYGILDSKLVEIDFKTFQLDGGVSSWPVVGDLWTQLNSRYGLSTILQSTGFNALSVAQDWAAKISGFLVSQSGNVLKTVGDSLVGLLILILTTFFFFRDGSKFVGFLKNMSPLPKPYENEIQNKLRDTIYAIVIGNFGSAVLQGITGAIGFMIAGVENNIFWGTIMAFASLIPYLGAALVWIPMGIALMIHGDMGWGVFVLLWGLCAVSLVDNVARPVLIGSRTKMHPLATFLVVLGGIFIFGLKGIIFGPLILSLTVTIVHMYQLEYRQVLD